MKKVPGTILCPLILVFCALALAQPLSASAVIQNHANRITLEKRAKISFLGCREPSPATIQRSSPHLVAGRRSGNDRHNTGEIPATYGQQRVQDGLVSGLSFGLIDAPLFGNLLGADTASPLYIGANFAGNIVGGLATSAMTCGGGFIGTAARVLNRIGDVKDLLTMGAAVGQAVAEGDGGDQGAARPLSRVRWDRGAPAA